MARIRSVHPGLFTDETFMELSPHAQVFMIGLWTEADDQGVFPWKPRTLKVRLMPAALVEAESLLGELLRHGVIARYEVDGHSWGAIRNFRKFQKPERPKAVHPLPDELRAFVALACNSHTCSRKPQAPIGDEEQTPRRRVADEAPSDHRPDTDDTPTEHRSVGDASVIEHRQVGDASAQIPAGPGPMERRGEEGREESPPSLPSEAQAPPVAERRGSRLPEGWAPDADLRQFASDLGLNPSTVAAQFGDYWRSKAGAQARKTDWSAAWRFWCRKQAEHTGSRQLRPGGGAPRPPGQPDLDWMHQPGAVESLLQ